jgi:hypothetical protein
MANTYDNLLRLFNDNPELTFQNDGYQYLSEDVKDSNAEAIKEISEILKTCVEGFNRFDNFKICNKRGIVVRMQAYWDSRFIGVVYINLDDFREVGQ